METTPALTPRKRLFDAATLSAAAPIVGFVLIVLVFAGLTDGKIVDPNNLKSLTNQVIVTALVAIGAVFVFGAGAFDMSLSGALGIAAIVGAKVGIATGSIPAMLVACLAVSLALGIAKGLLAAYIEIPFFILTIVIGTLLAALSLLIMGKETVLSVSSIPTINDLTVTNIVTLGGYFVAALVLFNYTRIGKSCKLIGGNVLAAKQSGIPIQTNKILAFLISAVGVGLAAFILLLRTKTAGATTGATVGIDIIVALVLGGMPLSGGPRSKISAALVGAATITVLNSGLTMIGLSNGTVQIFRGIIFLAVVWIASLNYRTALLPR